jgi:hypothetical protein
MLQVVFRRWLWRRQAILMQQKLSGIDHEHGEEFAAHFKIIVTAV